MNQIGVLAKRLYTSIIWSVGKKTTLLANVVPGPRTHGGVEPCHCRKECPQAAWHHQAFPSTLQVLQELPAHRAPGPDGLTYEVLGVDDDVFRAALLCFFERIRSWATVPSVWRTAVIKPLHKSGSAEEFTNYRPISLLCCSLKIFERLLLKRLLPLYTLAETLRLRGRNRTFCAFVDVRKAFDVAWRNAVLVKLAESGIASSMWKVLDDLFTDTSARVVVNGLLSQPWAETAGVRQGSVLGPLLFTMLFNSISTTVRRPAPV